MENQENMKKIQEAMEQAEKIKAGGDLKYGVPIDYTSDFGRQFKGTVVFKRPTLKDYMTIGGLKSELLRQAGVQNIRLVDPAILLMTEMVATLKSVVVKSPEWLVDIDNVEDVDLLNHVYDKFTEWEDSFRPKNSGTTSEDSRTANGEEVVGS